MEVFAGDVVGEGPGEFDAVEMAIGILVQGADPCVADALSVDDVPLTLMCQVDIDDPVQRPSRSS